MKISDILAAKPAHTHRIAATAPILQAVISMCDHKIGSLLVEDEQGQLSGILTERDILQAIAERGSSLPDLRVADAMTRDVIVVAPDTPINEAMSIVTNRRIRHLPVLQDGAVVGLVSIGDLLKAELDDVSVEVRFLRDYINA